MDPISFIGSDSSTAPKLLVLVGTSTGGPQALTKVFSSLPVISGASCLIVQHMPRGFTANLAKRLNQLSSWRVKEAENGEQILQGVAYIAKGGFQMRVRNAGPKYYLSVQADGPVNGHQPSVDSLFCSVANTWKEFVIGVIMTGMGKDGAIGLKEIQNRGGYTIAEAEKSCVVYGMPKAAVTLGAAAEVCPLTGIVPAIIEKSDDFGNLGKKRAGSDT